MITNGQLPLGLSTDVTARLASLVHASLMLRPMASNAATVVAAAGAALALQPSTVVNAIDPVIVGAVVSLTRIVCTAVLLFRHASFTV